MLRHALWLQLFCTGCLTINGIPVRDDHEDAGKESTAIDAGSSDPGVRDAGPSDAGGDNADATVSCVDAERDPLIGLWQGPEGYGTCEFYSNGRYREDCGLEASIPGDWKLLDDGRYYFSAINSFGAITDECIARPTFSEDCRTVALDLACSRGYPPDQVLELSRVD